MRRLMAIMMIGLVLMSAVTVAWAAPKKAKIIAAEEKELVGPVVYFTPRGAPTVIGVGHDATNTDYSFYIDENTEIKRKKSIKDIHVGDTVRVTYYDITRQTSGTGKRPTQERLAKTISFVRAQKKRLRARSASDTGSRVLVSD